MTQLLTGIAEAASPGGGGIMGILPLILMFAVLYFLILRPQSKKAKDHQRMLSELKKGDLVATQGGIIGTITGMKDGEVTIQVQEGVRLRMQRSAVSGLYAPAAPKADAPPKSEAKAS